MTTLREQLEFYDSTGGSLLRQLRRDQPRDYADFVDVFYADLEDLIGLMEGDAKDLMSASEDFLNRELVRLLNARSYIASHDHDEGGHVDIHVKPGNRLFTWLGEAKLDNGPEYILAGLHQLTKRYARGTAGHNCGGVLVYFQKDRCSERFAAWRERLKVGEVDNFEQLVVQDCNGRSGLTFQSDFVLNRIGCLAPKYQVRHIAVSLYRPASASAQTGVLA